MWPFSTINKLRRERNSLRDDRLILLRLLNGQLHIIRDLVECLENVTPQPRDENGRFKKKG
jgi:hypothetical protein